MRRDVPTGPTSTESEVRDTVRSAARPAGTGLETWLGETETGETGPARIRRPEPLEAVLEEIAQSIRQPDHAAAAPAVAASLPGAAETARALDRAATWIEQAEARLNQARGRDGAAAPTLSEALLGIEDRLGPVEGRAAEPAAGPALAAAALEGVEREIEALRGNLDAVATRADVAALDDHLHDLVEAFRRSAGTDRAVASLQQRLQSLAHDLPDELHRRVGPELGAIAARIDQIPDAATLEAFARQLDGIREDLGRGIGLGRVDRLAAELESVGRRVADLQAHQAGTSDLAAVVDGLEDIRDSVRRAEEDIRQRLTLGPAAADLAALGERLATLADCVERLIQDGGSSAESVVARVDDRLADFAERFDALARVGVTSAQSLADQLHEESTRVIGPMRSLSERIADLDRRLELLAADLTRPTKLAGERLGKLAAQLETLAAAAEPLAEIGPRVDGQIAGVQDRLDALAAAVLAQEPRTARGGEGLDALRSEVAALIAEAVAPVRATAANVERVADHMGALVDQVSVGPRPLIERLDRLEESLRAIDEHASRSGEVTASSRPLLERLERLEESLREVGEHADTLPLEMMMRSLQERFDRLAPALGSGEGIEERLNGIVQRLALTPAEPVQQALSESLAHLRALRGEAAMIAERAARAALKDLPVASAADLDAVREGFAELKALQANAEKKTQATLKAVHNALETLVMRMPAGVSIVPPASAPPADSPAVRLEAAVRKLHAAALAHAEDAAAPPAGTDEEVLLDPAAPRSALVPVGPSFTAPQEGGPGTVRASFIAAARRAAQAATAEAEASGKDEPPAPDKSPISNQTLIERIRQTFDGNRRPLLFGAALLMAAGSVPVVGGLRRDADGSAPRPKVDAPVVETVVPAARSATQRQERLDAAASLGPAAPLVAPASHRSGTEAEILAPAALGPAEIPAEIPASVREAARAGDRAALFHVAAALEEGRDVPRDVALAAKLFQAAAEAGFAPAQFRLAYLLERGTGVARDPALARSWYERAAAAGNTQAMHNLAVHFAEGRDGRPDYASAVRWFREASDHGVRDSQYNLAVLLARGVGANRDLGQSYAWFAAAAAEGDDDARRKRDEVAARLAPAELAAAKRAAEAWRPRPADPVANEVATPARGWTAAQDRSISHRS